VYDVNHFNSLQIHAAFSIKTSESKTIKLSSHINDNKDYVMRSNDCNDVSDPYIGIL